MSRARRTIADELARGSTVGSRLTAKVHALVVDFYREVAFDDLLGPMFGEVAEVDWATHIPKLIDYWCRVLLGQPGYEWAVPTRCPELNADLAAETGVG